MGALVFILLVGFLHEPGADANGARGERHSISLAHLRAFLKDRLPAADGEGKK